MIEDAQGRPLKPGDIVLIPCKIAELQAREGSCSLTLVPQIDSTLDIPTGLLRGIDAKQVLRKNEGDLVDYKLDTSSGKVTVEPAIAL